MTDTFIHVPFRDATLYLIDHQGEPYTSMKPIIEGMGLTWGGQYQKLSSESQRSSARNTLELIEQAQAEQSDKEGFNHA